MSQAQDKNSSSLNLTLALAVALTLATFVNANTLNLYLNFLASCACVALANVYKPPLIVKHHVQGLFSLPTIHYKDHKSLKLLINVMQSRLKSLQSLGRPVDQYGDMLVHLIQSKFDNSTIAAWEEKLKRDIPTAKQLVEFLKKRCETWESISR